MLLWCSRHFKMKGPGISHRAGLVLTTTPTWFNNPWLHNQLILCLDGNPAAQAATDEGRSHKALPGNLKEVWSFICTHSFSF